MGNLPSNATLYKPEGEIKAVLQIVHGMCEHQKRYVEFANFLTQNGFAVVTSDLRGHGDNVTCEEDLGYFGEEMAEGLLEDVGKISAYIKEEFPNVPYVLLGHSMGTLISTSYYKSHDNEFDGLILSGMPGDNFAKGIAKVLINIVQNSHDWKYRSPFVNNLCNGPFAKAFISEGNEFAWLSVDKENVKKYEEDPKCGYVFTLNGFYTLMDLMVETYNKKNWSKKKTSNPVYLLSGSDDPCMGTHENFGKSVQMFVDMGYNVKSELIDGQRHEIFNDTKKAETMQKVVDFLNEKIIGQ